MPFCCTLSNSVDTMPSYFPVVTTVQIKRKSLSMNNILKNIKQALDINKINKIYVHRKTTGQYNVSKLINSYPTGISLYRRGKMKRKKFNVILRFTIEYMSGDLCAMYNKPQGKHFASYPPSVSLKEHR